MRESEDSSVKYLTSTSDMCTCAHTHRAFELSGVAVNRGSFYLQRQELLGLNRHLYKSG